MLSDNAKKVLTIKPLVLVNLDILFRFAVGKGTFQQIQNMLEFYCKIIKGRRLNYRRTNNRGHWLQSLVGLDEVFHTLFFDKISGALKKPDMTWLIKRQGITQQLIDTIV